MEGVEGQGNGRGWGGGKKKCGKKSGEICRGLGGEGVGGGGGGGGGGEGVGWRVGVKCWGEGLG